MLFVLCLQYSNLQIQPRLPYPFYIVLVPHAGDLVSMDLGLFLAFLKLNRRPNLWVSTVLEGLGCDFRWMDLECLDV